MRAARSLAALAAAVGTYAVVVRPRMLRSGATDEEVKGPYPGSDLIPGGTRIATMATTIDAPPSRVWPWLVQMGCGRGGWYSWDRMDNRGVPSVDRIHPEWQSISVGDRIPATPDGSFWFEVAAVTPERFLALRATFDFRGRPLARTGMRPKAYTDSTWCFLLNELPDGGTRLVVSGYGFARPRAIGTLSGLLFWEPAHWIMQRRQFTNLKRRAEREPSYFESGTGPASVHAGAAMGRSGIG